MIYNRNDKNNNSNNNYDNNNNNGNDNNNDDNNDNDDNNNGWPMEPFDLWTNIVMAVRYSIRQNNEDGCAFGISCTIQYVQQ